MPLFVYQGADSSRGLELRKTVRERHLGHLQGLADAGKIRFAGPLLDETGQPCGSLIVFEAADLAAAQKLAESDPYHLEGIFGQLEVFETKGVFPKS